MGTLAEQLEDPLEHVLDPELQRELVKHPGKWAAVTRSEILAIGDSVAEVLRAAAESHPDLIPILHRVPEDDGTVYFY